VIEAIDERHAGLMADGRPLRIDFAIDLLRVDDPAGTEHGMTHALTNIPDWRVTLDGTDLTERMRPRLVSLAISEKRGDEADQLDIVLDDADGLLAIPPEGARLLVMLGWNRGATWPRPRPQGQLQGRRGEPQRPARPDPHPRAGRRFYQRDPQPPRTELGEPTLGTVLQDIAGRNALALRIAPDLAAIALPALHQSRESDTAFLRRLGRENDAVATIKTGTLIFARKGAGTTSTGQPLPTLALTAAAAMAIHGSARRATGRPVSPPTGTTARPPATAPSPWARPKARKPCARPTPTKPAPAAPPPPNTPASNAPPPPSTCASPWAAPTPSPKPASPSPASNPIDATPWLITEVTHRLDNTGGFITELKMEVAP
jgi:hypothetical protein